MASSSAVPETSGSALTTLLSDLIGIIPGVLWVALAWYIFAQLRVPILRDLLPNLRRAKGFGLELEVFERKLVEKAEKLSIVLDRKARSRLVRRMDAAKDMFREAQILWVDDNMDWNRAEAEILTEFGAKVSVAASSADGIIELKSVFSKFDLVISDANREGNSAEGIEFAQLVAESIDEPPAIILYVGTPQDGLSRPAHVFGITNRPDELFHLMVDALERRRL